MQATCLCGPWLQSWHSTLLLPLRIAIRQKWSLETPPCICPAMSGGKNIFLHAANTFWHPSSVQKPLADWVVPLSRMKKPLALALDCEIGYHSRVFLANAERWFWGTPWDSKHIQSGYLVAETWIQMRDLEAESFSKISLWLPLIWHPEATILNRTVLSLQLTVAPELFKYSSTAVKRLPFD